MHDHKDDKGHDDHKGHKDSAEHTEDGAKVVGTCSCTCEHCQKCEGMKK